MTTHAAGGAGLEPVRGGWRVALVLAAALCGLVAPACAAQEQVFDDATWRFLNARGPTLYYSIQPVEFRGRSSILDTVARERLGLMLGQAEPDGIVPAVAYLELYYNTGAYLESPLLYVKEKNMRAALEAVLPEPRRSQFRQTHRLAPAMLLDEEAYASLIKAQRVTREQADRAKAMPSLRGVLEELSHKGEYRLPLERLGQRYEAMLESLPEIPLSCECCMSVADQPKCWRERRWSDDKLGNGARPGAASYRMRRLELLYNQVARGTVLFVGFAAATVALLLGVAGRWRWAGWTGAGLFVLSTLGLLGVFVVRWVLSGRSWYLPPIVNQFEAVTGSALLGCLLGGAMELRSRRGYLALAASFYTAVALLAGFFLPHEMGATLSASHGILNSPVMAAHVAVIIIGHAMAGVAGLLSLGYVALRMLRRPAQKLDGLDRSCAAAAQLACWTLALGTALGAFWGDFAWGRWWGWDPKETWALLTVLVFVGAVHVRRLSRPSRAALVAAMLCLLGTAVMLFNWLVVNYLLAGKHSYA